MPAPATRRPWVGTPARRALLAHSDQAKRRPQAGRDICLRALALTMAAETTDLLLPRSTSLASRPEKSTFAPSRRHGFWLPYPSRPVAFAFGQRDSLRRVTVSGMLWPVIVSEDREKMFGKGKLLRDGAEAQGLVIESNIAASGQGGTVDKYEVKVRVRFGDGSTAEISGKLFRHQVGYHYEGAILPIRYDAQDRSKIEIDVPTLEARFEARTAEVKAKAIEQGERELAVQASEFAVESGHAVDGESSNPRADIIRLAIRQAMRKGDDAEVTRLTATLADVEHCGSD